MTKLYVLMLDLFPLSSMIWEENPVIGKELQHTALQLLLHRQREHGIALELLLRLSYDLGYLDTDVYNYLQKGLKAVLSGRSLLSG